MKKLEIRNNAHPRLNRFEGLNRFFLDSCLSIFSDSNSCQLVTTCAATTTMNNPYELKTRSIHFPEKYFNRPPYYGTLKKALTLQIDNLEPSASIDNVIEMDLVFLTYLNNCRLIIQSIQKANGKNHVVMVKNFVRMSMM